MGLLSKVTRGSASSAAASTTAVAPSTSRGRRLSGAKMRGSIHVPALRSRPASPHHATSAGSSVTLTNSPKNTPVPAMRPSSDTPENVVGMNE